MTERADQVLLRIDDVDLWVTLLDEYRSGLWQVQTDQGTQFIISTHVMIETVGAAD